MDKILEKLHIILSGPIVLVPKFHGKSLTNDNQSNQGALSLLLVIVLPEAWGRGVAIRCEFLFFS